jgi:hypothetical protein
MAADEAIFYRLPLVTEYGKVLRGRVWHGGCAGGKRAQTPEGKPFDLIVSLYPWAKFEIVEEQTARLEIPFYDDGELDLDLVRCATKLAALYLQRGSNVLIHCQGGYNRSSFVLGVLLVEHCGMPAKEAIEEIRTRRSPACFSNRMLARQLLRLG